MNISEVVECKSGTVHGIFVGGVSPIKKSQKRNNVQYFEANISDGGKTVRMVSFEPKLCKEVEDAYKNRRKWQSQIVALRETEKMNLKS